MGARGLDPPYNLALTLTLSQRERGLPNHASYSFFSRRHEAEVVVELEYGEVLARGGVAERLFDLGAVADDDQLDVPEVEDTSCSRGGRRRP